MGILSALWQVVSDVPGGPDLPDLPDGDAEGRGRARGKEDLQVAVLTTGDRAAAKAAARRLQQAGVRATVSQRPKSRLFTDTDGRTWLDVRPSVVLVGSADAHRASAVLRATGA